MALAAAFIFTGCKSAGVPAPVEKRALLRFENLSADTSVDWVGRALSEVAAREMGALSYSAIARAQQPFAPSPAAAPGISSEKTAAIRAGATHFITGYFTVSNGRLSVTAIEEDAATGKADRAISLNGDVFGAADSLARRFTANPKAFPTRNLTALRLYALGMESAGAVSAQFFEQATGADPNFGDAYLGWTRAAASTGNRAELDRALAAGTGRGAALPPLDRASLKYELAVVHGNTPAKIEALDEMVKAAPDNAVQLRTLGDAEIAVRRLDSGIGHYERALALTPEDDDLRNPIAYAKTFAGDFAGALSSIQEYEKRKPHDPNGVDSEGDVYFYFGKFADAERMYLRAWAMSADFNAGVDGWKAARARLMTGDVAGATQLFENFRGARAKRNDPLMPFREAEWQYLTGKRAQGTRAMAAAGEASTVPELRALCLAQAAIWEATAGQFTEARTHSALVLRGAASPSTGAALIARFLAQPKAPGAEWRARAEQEIKGAGAEPVRRLALAYAYAVSRDFNDAAQAWKAIYESANPNDQGPAFMYAWALTETGRSDAAMRIAKTNPIPAPVPIAGFESLYFPALFTWRGDRATFTKLAGIPAPAM